jgi:signal transduction histidine kinase
MAEGERLIRRSVKNRREILKCLSEECVTDLDSMSSYLEDFD